LNFSTGERTTIQRYFIENSLKLAATAKVEICVGSRRIACANIRLCGKAAIFVASSQPGRFVVGIG